MNKSKSPQNVINQYKKRQQMGPMLVWIIAIALLVGGLILLLLWLFGSGGPSLTFFATETATPTMTFTPTNTAIPTETPTITLTPSETPTPTPAAPFIYKVQEGDTLVDIIEKLGLGDNALQLIIYLNPNVDPSNLKVGDEILLPNPDMPLPTATLIPADLPRGTKIVYTIQSGDSLELIASKFNSTVDAMLALKENKEAGITDANTIFAGQKIVVPVNLVTPTPTLRPSVTPVFTATP